MGNMFSPNDKTSFGLTFNSTKREKSILRSARNRSNATVNAKKEVKFISSIVDHVIFKPSISLSEKELMFYTNEELNRFKNEKRSGTKCKDSKSHYINLSPQTSMAMFVWNLCRKFVLLSSAQNSICREDSEIVEYSANRYWTRQIS